MPTVQTLLMFATASLALAVIPGPTMLLALSNGMGGGLRRAAWGMGGATLGSVLVISVVAIGLGSLMLASAWLFDAVRTVGVLYLLWLAWQLWRSPVTDVQVSLAHVPGREVRGRAAFTRSLTVALSNPKSLLFFAAFLPQFVDPARSLWVQFAVMAGTFALVELVTELLIASLAHRISPWLQRVGRRFNQACGGTFAAIGIALPLRS
jgi:homoserine/homoserine lactone efflux protein